MRFRQGAREEKGIKAVIKPMRNNQSDMGSSEKRRAVELVRHLDCRGGQGSPVIGQVSNGGSVLDV
jgi:hypothetical protein